MKAKGALEFRSWIPDDKVKAQDVFRLQQIFYRAYRGIDPDPKESAFLQEVYRYTNGGGDKQDQPFKAYRRRTSWGD